MADILEFQALSTRNFSAQSLRMAEQALEVARSRYQDFSCGGFPGNFSYSINLNIPEEWKNYATNFWQNHDEFQPSTPITRELVLTYIAFFANSQLQVQEPQETLNLTCDNTIVAIPYYSDDQWALFVVYPDCIHWIDSGSWSPPPVTDPLSRPVRSLFQSNCNKEDSGVYMLLALYHLANKSPPPALNKDQDIIAEFRVKLLIQYLCHSLNPTESDFESLTPGFFDEAMYSRSCDSMGQVTITYEGCSNHAPDKQPQSPQSIVYTGDSSFEEISSPRSTSVPQVTDEQALFIYNNRKLLRISILKILSEASIIHRSSRATTDTDYEVLWSVISKRRLRNTLFYRYCSVLFYTKIKNEREIEVWKKMKHLGAPSLSTLKKKREECELWYKICEELCDWGDGRFVALCAVPSHWIGDIKAITKLHEALKDSGSPLRIDLDPARGLCCALIERRLPNQRLMIENFPFRSTEELTDQVYRCFLSLNPRPRLAVPPL